MSYKKNYWTESFLSYGEVSLFIHACRSFFHFLVLATGVFYAFVQPLFLNFEVWTYIYVLSASVLVIDAFIFIFYRHFKNWQLLYFLDALFIGLILYKTGFVFLNLLYSVWLMSIVLAGFQFHFKGAFLQGLFVSCLWTWLNLLSPHFANMSTALFTVNSLILFSTAGLSGFIGHRYHFFQKLFQFIRSEMKEWAVEWNQLYSTEKSDHEDSHLPQSLGRNNVLNQFLKTKLNLWTQDVHVPFDVIDVNRLVKEVIHELCLKVDVSKNMFECSLKSSHKIVGQKENLKKAMFGVIHLFASSNNLKKLSLTAYDDPQWIVISIKGKNIDITNPLWLFNNSLSSLFFIHKILHDHKGRIYADKKEFSVVIKFPLDQKNRLSSKTA